MLTPTIGTLSAPKPGMLTWVKAWWHARKRTDEREQIERQVERRERRYEETMIHLFKKKRRR